MRALGAGPMAQCGHFVTMFVCPCYSTVVARTQTTRVCLYREACMYVCMYGRSQNKVPIPYS